MEHFPFSLFFYLKLIWDTHTLQCAIVTVRNEVAKVMFLQACVCPHGGGVCLSACWDTTPPLGSRQPPPWSRHPTPRSRHPPPGSRQPPLGADPPSERRPPLRTVRILLECILVENMFGHMIFIPQYSVHSQGVPNVNF